MTFCDLLKPDVQNPFRQPHSWHKKPPGHILRSHLSLNSQSIGVGMFSAREALQGCHRPARPLQLLAVAVAAAAMPPVMGGVSIHLQVFPTRVHVFPRQGHSMSPGPRRTLKSLANYQLCYCVPTTSPQKVQTFRNILPPATKEGLKISPGLSK